MMREPDVFLCQQTVVFAGGHVVHFGEAGNGSARKHIITGFDRTSSLNKKD